ncbi:MAG: MoxR family ATPase [Deltaproteobacteria bacterium]|nr:MoxR family ATPase [Deltaproteobacteria bacterium]
MRLEIGYPQRGDEAQIIINDGYYNQARDLPQIMNPFEVIKLQGLVDRVKVAEKIINYILNIAETSLSQDIFRYGLSPRGSIALKKASQAWAFTRGRDYVIPDDVKEVFTSVTFHRLHPAGDLKGKERKEYLTHFLHKIAVPL